MSKIKGVSIPARDLRRQAVSILRAYGASENEAKTQADARVQGALRGHPGQGQGMRGIVRYCDMLSIGGIVSNAPFEVLVDTPAMALVDGHKGFGQVIAQRAMDMAIQKARTGGVGLVSVRHSNHLGITAYHAMKAAEQKMIGLCLTNAGPEMAPWGGITPTLGTNPWGLAAPTDLGFPIVLDMALSVSGKGMVKWYLKEGKKIPTDWAYDADGKITDDPARALEGPLTPIGAFKGTGLSIMTDILCGVLSGAAFGLSPYSQPTNHDVGHMLIALDIQRFLPYDDYLDRMRDFCNEIKRSALAPGFGEVLLPGELEYRRSKDREENGIPVDEETFAALKHLAAEKDIPFELASYEASLGELVS